MTWIEHAPSRCKDRGSPAVRVDIREESAARLDSYASVAIAFEVAEVFDVSDQPSDSGGFSLTRRRLDVPYVKDYDAIDGGPMGWAQRFDLSRWGLLAAYAERRRVGGAAVLVDAPEVSMPEARRELAVLWDIRVAPEARGDGVSAHCESMQPRSCRLVPADLTCEELAQRPVDG